MKLKDGGLNGSVHQRRTYLGLIKLRQQILKAFELLMCDRGAVHRCRPRLKNE